MSAPTEKPSAAFPAPAPGTVNSVSPAALFTSQWLRQGVAWLLLSISLAATLAGWLVARQHAQLEAQRNFEEEAARVVVALSERMTIYEGVLHGAVGLYAASSSVERDEWRAYLESVGVERRFPGVDGVGFVACVPRDRLAAFVQQTIKDNAPGFEARMLSTNAEFFITKYLEPELRHQSRLGLDLSSDPERRAGAEQARDSGNPAITPRTVVQDDGRGPQPGFMMLLPVYRHNAPVRTVEERRAAIEGWVFARFIIANLMREVLGVQGRQVTLEILDTREKDDRQLVFSSASEAPAGAHPPHFTTQDSLRFGGRTWQLRFGSTRVFEATVSPGYANLIGLGGILVSCLIATIAASLSTTKAHAVAMAKAMNATLLETNRRLETEMGERRRAEKVLRASETLYHSLVENLPLQILRKDLAGRFTFANQRFCATVGSPLDQVIGRTDADFLPPETMAAHLAEDRRVIEAGATIETVHTTPAKSGPPRHWQVIKTPMRDDAGEVSGLLGIYWDVTDKHRAEEALAHERFLMNTLMEHVPDRIYFKDTQSRFLRVNHAMAGLFRLADPDQAVGKSDFDFFGREHADQAYQDEQKIIRTGQPVIGLVERENLPDGSIRWALTTKMPLRDRDGRIIGTFGISRDYTALKQAEQDLLRAKEEAEEANRAKSQFLASMSHELRTPLNSVIGFANILLKNRSGHLSSSELNFVERIGANGRHLLGLINEILDLAKIEARKIELQLAPAALDSLVRETVAQEEGLVRDRPVQLLTELPASVAPYTTDAEKLKQILINLIGNALKFTESGSVTVRLRTDPATHQPTRIEVTDTGIGIPRDKLGLIFEAFQQAEAGTARKYGGTGLGLTISQALCHLLGYRIEVESELGRGSTFSIVFPAPGGAATPDSDPAGTARTQAPVAFAGRLVLAIDDELDSLSLLEHTIQEFGCRVLTARTAEEGLRLARESHPDLITVDLMMPGVDGWEVVRRLKAEPALRSTPVVVVSVVAAENRGRVVGAVEVLQKPLLREDLLGVLRRHLSDGKPRILVVDDDADARRLLVSQLEDVSADVRTAANGAEALDQLREFQPDLIVLDLLMPVMDGATFLEALRSQPRFANTAVVIVSGKELTRVETENLRRQACEIMRKGEVFASGLRGLLTSLFSVQGKAATNPCTEGSPTPPTPAT